MTTLVIVEHNNQKMHPVVRHVLTAAKLFKEKVVLLVVGYNCQPVAEEAATLSGVDSVWVADNLAYQYQMPENIATLIVEHSASIRNIITSSSTFGKNLLPRVAALLDVVQVSDVIRVIDAQTFEHPIYAGNALETVRVLDEKMVLTIRTTAFTADTATQPPCTIEPIESNNNISPKSVWVDCQLNQSTRPELTQAKIVVSGGRALQNQENFQLIEQLADVLGGAVGASRAAVDAGYVSNDYQVGQTRKVVAPQLYFAIGISGAVQHLAGMKDAKIIVAINKDEEAPMMQIATYYLVGDLFELVPKLIERLKKDKASE